VQQCVRELTSAGTAYSVEVDDSKVDDAEVDGPEVVIMLIKTERKSCFHIAVPWSNVDVKNAKEICAQQVLYRTEDDDPDVYFAVYDARFNLSSQQIEDISQHLMEREQDRVAQRLKAYIASNVKVLS
jgi:hypothetical protein